MQNDNEKEEVVVVKITVVVGGYLEENVVNEKEQRGLGEE